MIRRVVARSCCRVLSFVVLLTLGAICVYAQSSQARLRSGNGPIFLTAPFVSLSANPTSIATGDLNRDGKLDLVVTKKGSSNVTVLLGDGKGGFAPGVEYPAGAEPGNALLADLNGDDKLDLVVTDNASGAIDVLFGNGDGTFGKASSYGALQHPIALALGNFRGKGNIDLAVASSTGLAVLLNDGSGRFPNAISLRIGAQPTSLTTADLKGAGHDDLILANANGSVSVLAGDGTGNFTPLTAQTIGAGSLSSIVAADFNGDGKPDLAVTQPNSGSLSVLLGRGDGTFQTGASYAVGNGPSSVRAASLTGNGAADLITVNRAANTFSVLLGNGDGTFKPAAEYVAGNAPLAAASGDFNADGHADLAIVNSQDATVSIPLGLGDGSFIAARAYKSELETKAIASGDLNGDGLPDLVVTNYCGSDSACASEGSATVFLANKDGSYRAGSTVALGSGPIALALADLNGDKKLDLVALNRNDKTMMVMAGNGDGTFGSRQLYSLPSSPRALFVADFNGDKIPDLAIASDCGQTTCTEPGTLDVWLGHGDGSLTALASYAVGYSPVSIAAGDLHGTGHLDLVVANACGDDAACQSDGTATLLSGDGAGKFTAAGKLSIGKSPSAIAIGNLSGSGLDLAVAQHGSNQVSVFHGNGSGGFGAAAVYRVGSAPSALAIADFNGDGKQDLAVANFQSSTVSVLNGTGSGPLEAAQTYTAATGPESLVAVGASAGHSAGLASANGNTGANPLGNEITLFKIPPQAKPLATISVTVNPTTVTVDGSEVLTANLTGIASTPPTGTVTFTSAVTPAASLVCAESTNAPQDNTVPSTVVSAGNGTATATCTTTSLLAGSDTISASLNTDPNFSGGTGSTGLTINAANTSTVLALTTGNNPSIVDDVLTFTATVTVPAGATVNPSGSVAFTDNGSPISTSGCGVGGVVAFNSSNFNSAAGTVTYSCTTDVLTAGTHAIIATFNGSGADTNYNTSNNFLVQTVNHAGGTMTFTSSSTGNTSKVNEAVTLTATISSSTGNTHVPFSGTFTFSDNGGSVAGCTVAFNTTTGVATCTTSSLALGPHPLKATYSNDPSYQFTAQTLTQTVNQQGTSTALASSSPIGTSPAVPTSAVNQSVTFTATVTPTVSGVTALSGAVTFVDTTTSTTLCSGVAVLPATGVATCTTSSLALGSHTIKATYGSDTNFSGSNNTVTQNVVGASTSVALSASPSNTSTVNQTVVFIATVTANPSGGTALNGTVAFTDNGVTIAGCSAVGVTAGVANCSDSSLTALGSPHTIKATYGNDTNFTGSSTTLSQTVNQAATTVSLVASPNPSNVNQAVTLTATVSPANGSVGLSGAVALTDNGGSVAGCTVSFNAATGIASCTTSSLTLGSHPITATYSSDPNFKNGSGNVTQTVSTATTTVALTSSSPSGVSTVNQAVQFTATITAPSGSSTLNGTVQFTDNGTTIAGCSALSPTSGVAVCPDSALVAGVHTIGAVYSHDTNFGTSSGTFSQTVNQGTTTSSLSASPGVSTTVNQAVTFTATVSATPTGSISLASSGTMTFTDSVTSAPILGCSSLPLSVTGDTGTVTCTTSALTLGPHTITASFVGDPNFSTSNKTLLQTVTPGSATVALSSSAPSSAVNESVTFTARVTPSPSGNIALSGKVSFTDTPQGGSASAISGCTNVALVIVGGVAQATCTTSSLALGSHTISAGYGSDSNFTAASPGTTPQTVSAASSSIALTSSAGANASTVNQTVVFTASIFVPTGPNTPSSTFAFTDNGTTICSGIAPTQVSGTNNWTAPCTDQSLTAGSHAIVANYGPDTHFTFISGSLTQNVNAGTTTVSLGNPQNPSVVNQSVTFTAIVTPNPSGPVKLSGNVKFVDSVTGQPITTCASPVTVSSAGQAACTTSALAVGSHTVTATYANDANFTGSSSTFVQTVNTASSSINIASSTGGTSIVNQSVMFTATIPVPTGAPNPTGTVSFRDNNVPIGRCTGVHPTLTTGSNNWTAACSVQNLIAGAHTILASYGGDINLTVGDGSAVQQVAQGQSQTVLTSNLSPAFLAAGNTANFKDSVIFTATVSVVPPAGSTVVVPLSVGTVNFSVNGIAICTGASVTAGVAACATTTTTAAGFTDGPNGVVATYANDPNYQTSNGPFNQLIEDYAIGVSPVPANAVGVLVTEGFTTGNDPFAPGALSVTPASTANFSGSPALTCSGAGTGAPACGFKSTSASACSATATLPIAASGVQQSLAVCIDATKATPGTYTMTMTATDPTTSIVRTTTFPVTVRGLSAALTVVSGQSTGNQATIKFSLPAGVSLTLTSSSCGLATGPELSGAVNPQTLFISCSFQPSNVKSSTSPQTASVDATITTGSGTTSSLDQHSTLFFAGLLGLPIFGLFGLLGGRKSTRTIFLRLLAVVAICVAGWQISGCGGSFHGTNTVTSGGQTPPGAYYVLVTGTGSDGNSYEAVIQLNVTL